MGHLQASRLVPAPAGEVFQFISDLENLPLLLTPHVDLDFPSTPPQLSERSEVSCVLRRFGLEFPAVVRVEEFAPGERISYRLISGFFPKWNHSEILKVHDERTTLITDLVDFQLPFGVFGALADDLFMRRDLQGLMTLRLVKIEEHFARRRDSLE